MLRLRARAAPPAGSSPASPLSAALRAARRQIRRRKLTRFYEHRLARSLPAAPRLAALPVPRGARSRGPARSSRARSRPPDGNAPLPKPACRARRPRSTNGASWSSAARAAWARPRRPPRSACARRSPGRRVLVCTIDPSRRLATSLGLGQLSGRPRALDLARHGTGARRRALRDGARRQEHLRRARAAATRRTKPRARRILENRFYQQVSAALAGSHEYMAMEKLLELSEDERFDLVVLDTPPTRHALDFLEAPDRLLSFLDTSVLRFFLKPVLRGRPAHPQGRHPHGCHRPEAGRPVPGAAVPAGPLRVLPRLRGDVRWLQGAGGATCRPCCATHARASCWWRGPSAAALEEALYFHRRLVEKKMPFVAFVVNRVHLDPARERGARGGPQRARDARARRAAPRELPRPAGARARGAAGDRAARGRHRRAAAPRARARAGRPRPARPAGVRRARSSRAAAKQARAAGGRVRRRLKMRIILYSGKGGVGKTSLSAATAIRAARLGQRTLVVSTDSAHSLADALDAKLGGEPTPSCPGSTRWRSTSTRSSRATGAVIHELPDPLHDLPGRRRDGGRGDRDPARAWRSSSACSGSGASRTAAATT